MDKQDEDFRMVFKIAAHEIGKIPPGLYYKPGIVIRQEGKIYVIEVISIQVAAEVIYTLRNIIPDLPERIIEHWEEDIKN